MASDPSDAPPRAADELGVLVVHGIGTQSRGATLDTTARALARHLDGWLAPGAERRGTGARLHAAAPGWPSPPGTDPDEVPPTQRLELRDPASGAPRSWLLAESWWAECFEVPDRREVAGWMTTVGPWFVFATFVRVFRRIWHRPNVVVRLWDLAVWTALLALVGAPLAVLGAVVMAVLWIAGLVPGPPGALARRTQLILSQTIGDAYTLLALDERRAHMENRVRDDLAALATVVGPGVPIAVVAHSQGAYLAHTVLRVAPPPELGDRPVLFLSHGSGIAPLFALGQRKLHPGLRGVPSLAAMLFVAFAGLRVAVGGLGNLEPAVGVAAAALLVLALVSALARRDPGPDDLVLADPGGSLRWLDVHATLDPVPNGPLLLEPPHPSAAPAGVLPLGVEVTNRAQPWLDHSGYAPNDEEHVSRVAGALGALAGWATTPGVDGASPVLLRGDGRDGAALLRRARRNRRRRARALVVAQITVVASVALVGLWRWREVPITARNLYYDWFPARLQSLLGGWADAVPESWRDAVLGLDRDPARLAGIVVVVLGLAVVAAILAGLHGAWQTSATSRMRAGRAPRAAPAAPTLFALVALGFPAVVWWIGANELFTGL